MEETVKNEQATAEKPKQLSYEELKNVAGQLQQQNMQMRNAINQMQAELQDLRFKSAVDRIKYLFKVLDHSYVFPEKFVDSCVKEIQESLTYSEDKEETEEGAKEITEE